MKRLGVEFVLEFSILLRVLNVFIILIFYLINIKIAFSLCRSLDHLMSVRLKVCRSLSLSSSPAGALWKRTQTKNGLCVLKFETQLSLKPRTRLLVLSLEKEERRRGRAAGAAPLSP